jgi:hypothetical protein
MGIFSNGAPLSALPGISPSRGEIIWGGRRIQSPLFSGMCRKAERGAPVQDCARRAQ